MLQLLLCRGLYCLVVWVMLIIRHRCDWCPYPAGCRSWRSSVFRSPGVTLVLIVGARHVEYVCQFSQYTKIVGASVILVRYHEPRTGREQKLVGDWSNRCIHRQRLDFISHEQARLMVTLDWQASTEHTVFRPSGERDVLVLSVNHKFQEGHVAQLEPQVAFGEKEIAVPIAGLDTHGVTVAVQHVLWQGPVASLVPGHRQITLQSFECIVVTHCIFPHVPWTWSHSVSRFWSWFPRLGMRHSHRLHTSLVAATLLWSPPGYFGSVGGWGQATPPTDPKQDPPCPTQLEGQVHE